MAKAKKPAPKPAAKKSTATKSSKSSLKTTVVDTPPRKTHREKQAAIRPPTGPVFRGLRTVIYQAPDLAVAKAFYIAVTGKAPYFDQPFYVGFEVGGFELGLDPDCSKRVPGPNGAVAYWRVDEIGASFAHATAVGGSAVEMPHDVGGGIQVAIVGDPFGNLVGLVEMP